MALTGAVLFIFVIGHLAGNLQVFLGRQALNRYGHFLQSNPELLWPARVVLLLMVGLHLWTSVKLSLENRAARPVLYEQQQPAGATWASRTMLWSGAIILVFVIYHLLHFTAQIQYLNLTGQDFGAFQDPATKWHDIFKMMVVGFGNAWVSGFYILGMALLCLHLSHGASSMFQSLGWNGPVVRPMLDRAARIVALLIFLGYCSIPTAILLGYGKEALK